MPVLYEVYTRASNACSIHGLHERFEGLFVLYTMLYMRASSACFIYGLYENLECLFYIRFIRALRVFVLYTVYTSASSSCSIYMVYTSASSACFIYGLCERFECLEKLEKLTRSEQTKYKSKIHIENNRPENLDRLLFLAYEIRIENKQNHEKPRDA